MKSGIDEVAVLGSRAARFSDLARSCDLATPIGHLGRWKIRDLVAHLGGVHRWASGIVVARSMDGPSFTQSKLDGTALCEWFDEGVEELIDVLRATNRDAPCPNFNPGSVKTAAWWMRRQMHETLVHAWDIERALDCITPIDPAVGADGVDEFLDVFIRTRGKQTLAAPLVLATDEPSRAWTLTLGPKPGRLNVASGRSRDVATELSGEAGSLLLVLWGRLSISEAGLTVAGDSLVAETLVA